MNRIKIIYIILIAIVAVFELYTFRKIFHPNVSDQYKLYYIDKKLYSWSHGQGIQYNIGSELDYASIERFLSRSGWYRAKNAPKWSKGEVSSIYFKTSNIEKYKGNILLNLKTFGMQSIRVTLNGISIGNKKIDSKNIDTVFNFKPEILYENKINTLQFNFPNLSNKHNTKDSAISLHKLKIN